MHGIGVRSVVGGAGGDQLAVVDNRQRVAEALRPDARFLIDIMVLETVLPIFEARRTETFADSGRRVTQETHVDFARSRFEQEWTFVEAGETRSARASLRLYSIRELCDLLREAGFVSFEAFDSVTGEPFAVGAKRLGLVASL